jgi:hypothetical protein
MKIFARSVVLFALVLTLFVSIPAFARNMNTTGKQVARPTLTPTPSISATVQPKQETAVEWQDGYGNWHTVVGWQSPFNTYKQVTWAVAANDFGKGPFRWVVDQGELTIVVSSDFYLPLSASETVTRHVMP